MCVPHLKRNAFFMLQRIIFLLFILAGTFLLLLIGREAKNNVPAPIILSHHPIKNHPNSGIRLAAMAAELKHLAKGEGYNRRYCFLIDFKIPSGKNRFFVYDMEKDSVLVSGLVTHGSGSDVAGKAVIFSNEAGSNASSLGIYAVGDSYQGRFGLAYKLHGLNATNSRAFERFVVLHAHSCVPSAEVAPETICVSLGCPTVAPDFLERLRNYLNEGKLLMRIYQ
jgi:hypothetical protein